MSPHLFLVFRTIDMNAQKLIDNFSGHLKNVIARGISLAAYFNHGSVDPLHLLIALTEEEGCVAKEILKKNAVESEYLRALARARIAAERAERDEIQRQPLPDLNQLSRGALEKALTLAYERGHNYIGTEHLLYGILMTKSDSIDRIIKECRVDPKTIAQSVEASLQNTSRFGELNDMMHAFEEVRQLPDMLPFPLPPAMPMPRHGTTGQKTQESVLEQFTIELTDAHVQSHIDPVVGRAAEIDRLVHILARRTKNNPILVGEPGVGKTAIVEGLAKKIAEGKVPDILKRKKIFSLDLTMLIAGTIYRGEFEARLKQIVDEIADHDNYILFIDELHNIIGAGSNQGTLDAANILKPALARGLLRCIGATTFEEYKRHVASDPALERRFQAIQVEEPTAEETLTILKGIKSHYEQFHAVTIDGAALTAAIEYSTRYLTAQFQPDKSIDLLDEAAAMVQAKQKHSRSVAEYCKLVNNYEAAGKEKQRAIEEERLQDALEWKRKENELKVILEKTGEPHAKKHKLPRVTADDVIQVIASTLHMDAGIIGRSEWENLETLDERLIEHIVGQDAAIKHIIDTLKRGYLMRKNAEKPLASLLLAGPNGVGKTELAKQLAASLYHDPKALIRLDMSEFAEPHSVSKILGSPAGYIGYNDRNRIADEIRRRPYSVILFDEIDKAHPDVVRLLLQILDEGQLTDSSGKKIFFKQSIIIATTNLGAELFKSAGIGFGTQEKDSRENRDTESAVMHKLKQELGTAFLSRMNAVCVLYPLTREHVKTIIFRHIDRLNIELSQGHDISIRADERAMAELIAESYTADLGARNVERTVERVIHGLVIDILKKKQRKEAYKLTRQREKYVLI